VEKFLIDGYRVTNVESIVHAKAVADFTKYNQYQTPQYYDTNRSKYNRKWKKFKKKYGDSTDESKSVIGYHGTEPANVPLIIKKVTNQSFTNSNLMSSSKGYR